MEKRLTQVILLTAGVIAAVFAHPVMADQTAPVRDSFEATELSSIWNDRHAPANRLAIRTGDARDGRRSLALTVRPGDNDAGCKCQRVELQEAEEVQAEFGSQQWYRFSLRISDFSGTQGDGRWVLGGWKQDVDGSPFLALRFDGGVFYITMESAQTRIMLGSTLLDARAFIQVMKGGQGQKLGFVTDRDLYIGDSGVALKHGRVKYLPDPRAGWVDLMFHISGGLGGDGIIEVFANGNLVVRATGRIGVDAPVGSKQYFRVGHRRDKAATSAALLLDDFRRGPTRESVE